MSDQSRQIAWCFFRNSLHAAYREIRHLGPPNDPDAKAVPPKGYEAQASKCRSNRHALKYTVPYRSVKSSSTADYEDAYKALTGLALQDLSTLFATANWCPKYGGAKWAAITNLVISLRAAIDSDDEVECKALCSRLSKIRHNSGPLVPSRTDWEHDPWKREKWPELCEP